MSGSFVGISGTRDHGWRLTGYTLGRIFHKEILFIQEVPVLFVTYIDIQGVITEVVYILTETQDGFVIEHNNGRNEELERSFDGCCDRCF